MLDILKSGRMNHRKINKWEKTCVDETVKNGFIIYNKDKKDSSLALPDTLLPLLYA